MTPETLFVLPLRRHNNLVKGAEVEVPAGSVDFAAGCNDRTRTTVEMSVNKLSQLRVTRVRVWCEEVRVHTKFQRCNLKMYKYEDFLYFPSMTETACSLYFRFQIITTRTI